MDVDQLCGWGSVLHQAVVSHADTFDVVSDIWNALVGVLGLVLGFFTLIWLWDGCFWARRILDVGGSGCRLFFRIFSFCNIGIFFGKARLNKLTLQ